MAIVLTGTMTVTTDAAPHLTAATLTALLAKAPEQMTVPQLQMLIDACDREAHSINVGWTVGQILLG